ncbi:hypothetical protein RhiirA4_514181, partial [Rhizophagus irregularis]
MCINDNSLGMNGERLKMFQQKLEGVKYIITDEKRRGMLALTDMRLRQAFPDHKNEPFGGRSIILFGILVSFHPSSISSYMLILLRLRDGESIIEDWEILNSRIEDKQSRKERNRFSDATFILPRWINVEQVNMEKLRSLNRPVAKILAVHTGAKNADS